MSKTNRIVRNTLVLNAGHIIAKLMNFALILILTQMLGSKGYGLYSFALAYVMMFMVFTQLGMNTFLVHDLAKDTSRAKKVFSTAFPTMLLLSIGAIALLNLFPWLLNWSSNERLIIAIFSIYMFFDGISRFSYAVFRAFQKMQFETYVYVFERAGILISAIILWQTGVSLILLVTIFTAVEVLKSALGLWFIHRRFVPLAFHWNGKLAASILKQSYPFALIILFGAVMMNIDSVMLKLFHSPEVVGIYSAGRRLVESLTFIPETFVAALFPALSALFISNRQLFNRHLQRAVQYVFIIAVPIVLILFTFAPQIIHLLFRPEFAGASLALRWLSIWLGILFVKHIFVVALNATGQQRLVSLFIGAAMALNVGLNYLLIPTYIIWGACLATIIAEAVTAACAIWTLRQQLSLPKFTLAIAKTVVAGAGMLFAMLVCENHQWILAAGVGGISYLALLFILRTFEPDEIRFFFGLLKSVFVRAKSL